MDEDLAALFKLLDSHIKGNSDSEDDQLKRFLYTLEKKSTKSKRNLFATWDAMPTWALKKMKWQMH